MDDTWRNLLDQAPFVVLPAVSALGVLYRRWSERMREQREHSMSTTQMRLEEWREEAERQASEMQKEASRMERQAYGMCSDVKRVVESVSGAPDKLTGQPANCRNCGAPWHPNRCAYCDTPTAAFDRVVLHHDSVKVRKLENRHAIEITYEDIRKMPVIDFGDLVR